jgi:hypothetical protein
MTFGSITRSNISIDEAVITGGSSVIVSGPGADPGPFYIFTEATKHSAAFAD